MKDKKTNQEGSRSKTAEAGESAIELLKQDHAKVKELFERFEKTEDDAEKGEIVREAITELKIHAAIEEEIFYPALREVAEEDIMDEADEEHHVVKLLIAELEEMEPGDDHFDAKFTVLAENVRHHIKEEESEIFPKAKEAGADEMGEEMLARKQELQEELGEDEASEKPAKASARSRKR